MSDAVAAARWQFAFTILFHYLFPVLTMGLGARIMPQWLWRRWKEYF